MNLICELFEIEDIILSLSLQSYNILFKNQEKSSFGELFQPKPNF